MNVKLIPTKDHKFVEIYVDGQHYETRQVQTEDGKEFIYVPNLLRQDGGIVTKGSFLHRIGDLVEHIRRGWGDVIQTNHLIVRTQHLVWYLDREYGNFIRKQSLAGWKGAEFSWAVFEKNILFGDAPLTVYGDTRPILVKKFEGTADHFEIQYYDSEATAQKFIDNAVNAVKPLLDKLYAIPDDEEHAEEIEAYYNQYIHPLTGVHRTIALYHRNDGKDHTPLYAGQIIHRANIPLTESKIFVAHMNSGNEFYMCRGDALDRADDDLSDNLIFEIMHGATVTEATLKHPANINIFSPDKDLSKVSIYRISMADQCTSWYWSMDECFNDPKYLEIKKHATEHGKMFVLEEGELHAQKLMPTIPTEENPYVMTFSKGDRGLIGKANLRPDEVGKIVGKNKVYFPDKSCAANLCAGKVRVTSVNDRGNYGFIKGTMVTYAQPTESELAEWIANHITLSKLYRATLHFIVNPKWGSAIKLERHDQKRDPVFIAMDEAGHVDIQDDLLRYDHCEDEVTRSVDLKDYLCTVYTSCTHGELCNIVTHVAGLSMYDLNTSCKYISDAFDEAIEIGLIDLRTFGSFNVCIVDENRMCKAASRLQNDLIEVLEAAKTINDEALIRIANMRRKGRL